MRAVDFDKLFDEYVRAFLEKTKGKYTEEQLEDVQPKLFEKFSKLKIKNIGNLTPDEYYSSKSDSLLEILRIHVRDDVSVNDFLRNRIVSDVPSEVLIENLNEQFDSAYLMEIIKILNLKNEKKAFNRYIDLLFSKNLDEDAENLIIEILSENADEVYGRVLESAGADTDSMVAEIVSSVKVPKAEIGQFLKNALGSHRDKIPEYLSYIVKYGDDGMVDQLYKLIDSEEISYVDYKELKIAIEALGVEYTGNRDFSSDKNYKILKGEE